MAEPDPGFPTVEWGAPVAASRDVRVLPEIQGPGIDSVRAPHREFHESSATEPSWIIVARVLWPGPVLQFRVPDGGATPRFARSAYSRSRERTTVGQYGAAITPK